MGGGRSATSHHSANGNALAPPGRHLVSFLAFSPLSFHPPRIVAERSISSSSSLHPRAECADQRDRCGRVPKSLTLIFASSLSSDEALSLRSSALLSPINPPLIDPLLIIFSDRARQTASSDALRERLRKIPPQSVVSTSEGAMRLFDQMN